jgi:hypothetical protein
MDQTKRWALGKAGVVYEVDANGRLEKAVPTMELFCPQSHSFRVMRPTDGGLTLVICPRCDERYLVPSDTDVRRS